MDDEVPSGAAGEDKKNNRYSAADKCYPKWDHNVNLTNNGTINFTLMEAAGE